VSKVCWQVIRRSVCGNGTMCNLPNKLPPLDGKATARDFFRRSEGRSRSPICEQSKPHPCAQDHGGVYTSARSHVHSQK